MSLLVGSVIIVVVLCVVVAVVDIFGEFFGVHIFVSSGHLMPFVVVGSFPSCKGEIRISG